MHKEDGDLAVVPVADGLRVFVQMPPLRKGFEEPLKVRLEPENRLMVS